jgi:hypothetical protein
MSNDNMSVMKKEFLIIIYIEEVMKKKRSKSQNSTDETVDWS